MKIIVTLEVVLDLHKEYTPEELMDELKYEAQKTAEDWGKNPVITVGWKSA